jgi:SAM-dependent methyltransferase
VAWFEEAFEGHYLAVYAHRDEAAAEREVEFALRALQLSPGSRVLDLASGAGRHALALAGAGMQVTGMDLSPDLLRTARNRLWDGRLPPEYVRGDMRSLPFRQEFRAVTMFFTSFGYFETEEEDMRVLQEVTKVLVPGGRFLLDYLNRPAVESSLVPESEEMRGDVRIAAERRITPDGRRVEKHVRIFEGEELVRDYTESVRMYERSDVERMMDRAGVPVARRYGDLTGSPWDERSPRLVLVGRTEC